MKTILLNDYMNTTSLPDSVCSSVQDPISILNQQLRDLYKNDKDLFFKYFGIEAKVAMAINMLSGLALSADDYYRILNKLVVEAYIDSFPNQTDRDDLRRSIDAGADIFYPGYRRDVFDGFPEAYITDCKKHYSHKYGSYVYDVT